jgi:5-methylcytosine-specific restriction endonuclease McrBC GTP-binding regulatory subunit McrB
MLSQAEKEWGRKEGELQNVYRSYAANQDKLKEIETALSKSQKPEPALSKQKEDLLKQQEKNLEAVKEVLSHKSISRIEMILSQKAEFLKNITKQGGNVMQQDFIIKEVLSNYEKSGRFPE